MDGLIEDLQKVKSIFDSKGEKEAIEWLKEKSKKYIKLMSYYKCAMMEIETKFNVLNEEFSLEYDRNPISSIKTRLKNPESIIDKIERRGFDKSIESVEKNINDVAGIRVICPFCDDVFGAVKRPVKSVGWNKCHGILVKDIFVFLSNENSLPSAYIQDFVMRMIVNILHCNILWALLGNVVVVELILIK